MLVGNKYISKASDETIFGNKRFLISHNPQLDSGGQYYGEIDQKKTRCFNVELKLLNC